MKEKNPTLFREDLLEETKILANYALRSGVSMQSNHLVLINSIQKEDQSDETFQKLLKLYSYLVKAIQPAHANTVVEIEKYKKENPNLKRLGPLPIVRNFILLAMFSLFCMIGLSLFTEVNERSMMLSMLEGSGISQVLRLAFLLSCASVGACFYALFKMNAYIASNSFNINYNYTYWTRYILGLFAGLLLSEIFINAIADQNLGAEAAADETPFSFLLKPVLAILGGFSANLVYRILNKLVESIESLFKGEMKEMVERKTEMAQKELEVKENQVRQQTAKDLLQLKSSLIATNATPEIIEKMDATLTGLVGEDDHFIHPN